MSEQNIFLVLQEAIPPMVNFTRDILRLFDRDEILSLLTGKMQGMRFDSVERGTDGSLTARVGSGEQAILFHCILPDMEETPLPDGTVGGEMRSGILYGSEASAKCALVAAMYAAGIIKRAGAAKEHSIIFRLAHPGSAADASGCRAAVLCRPTALQILCGDSTSPMAQTAGIAYGMERFADPVFLKDADAALPIPYVAMGPGKDSLCCPMDDLVAFAGILVNICLHC